MNLNIYEQSSTPNIVRLRAEMDSLRKVYEEQTEKAKNEYMMIHSKKVIKNEIIRKWKVFFLFFQLTELQEQLSRERSGGLASRNELEDWRSRVDQNKVDTYSSYSK